MEKKLKENDHKSHWKHIHISKLYHRLEQEMEELEAEILGGSEEETEEEKAARIALESEEGDLEEDPEPKPEEEGDPEPAKEEKPGPDPEQDPEEKPDNTAFARMRHEKKQLEKRVAELEKKPDPHGEAVDKTVGKLVKVWESGVGDEGALLAGVRKAGTQEVMDIHSRAVAGEYGEMGEDVIKMIARELPMIQAREAVTQKDASTRKEALVNSFRAEAEQAKADFPAYADAESPEAKAKVEFDKSYLGTLDPETGEPDGTGILPEDLTMYLHSHPYVAHQFADAVFKGKTLNSDTSKAEMVKLTSERDSFKDRLAKYESIEAPSSSASSAHKKGSTSLEDLEKEILS